MRRILRQPLVIALLLVLVLTGIFFARRTQSTATSKSHVITSATSALQTTATTVTNNQKQGGENVAQAASLSYTKKSSLPALVSEVLAAHTLIYTSANHMVAGGSRVSDNVPGFLASSQSVLSTDVLSYLEQASDKEAAVDTMLGQLEYYRGAGEGHLQSLQSTIQDQTTEYNRCTKEKTSSDALFYTALRAGDAMQVQQSIDDSQNSASCQAKARVVVNANKAMLERTQASYTAMGNLSSILQSDRALIIDHFDLFRSNKLEQLVAVRNTLRIQKFTTSE